MVGIEHLNSDEKEAALQKLEEETKKLISEITRNNFSDSDFYSIQKPKPNNTSYNKKKIAIYISLGIITLITLGAFLLKLPILVYLGIGIEFIKLNSPILLNTSKVALLNAFSYLKLKFIANLNYIIITTLSIPPAFFLYKGLLKLHKFITPKKRISVCSRYDKTEKECDITKEEQEKITMEIENIEYLDKLIKNSTIIQELISDGRLEDLSITLMLPNADLIVPDIIIKTLDNLINGKEDLIHRAMVLNNLKNRLLCIKKNKKFISPSIFQKIKSWWTNKNEKSIKPDTIHKQNVTSEENTSNKENSAPKSSPEENSAPKSSPEENSAPKSSPEENSAPPLLSTSSQSKVKMPQCCSIPQYYTAQRLTIPESIKTAELSSELFRLSHELLEQNPNYVPKNPLLKLIRENKEAARNGFLEQIIGIGNASTNQLLSLITENRMLTATNESLSRDIAKLNQDILALTSTMNNSQPKNIPQILSN